MKRQEPRFIYFDMGNVLLYFDHRRASKQISELVGIPEEVVWRVVFDSGLEFEYEAGKITGQEFHQIFCSQTATSPDPELFLHAASAIFDVNAGLVPIVSHLRQAGYRLGILSNTNEAHWRFVNSGRFALIQHFFSIATLSYEVRAMKPEKAIYAAAAALAGVAPGEIFFTDDRHENVAGAIAAGFDAVLFEGSQQLARELRARNIRWNY